MLILALSLTSCDKLTKSQSRLDEEKHITFEHTENGNIIYQGNEYYLSQMSFLWTVSNSDYKYLGWSGSEYLSNSTVYGDSEDKPLFLYFAETRSIYLRNDYDYTSDTFIIEGTDDTVVFSEALTDVDAGLDLPHPNKEVIISSVKYPILKAQLYVYGAGNDWYAKTRTLETFKLSDKFIGILEENALLDGFAENESLSVNSDN